DLNVDVSISLIDSIVGGTFIIPHFIGRRVTVDRRSQSTKEGEVVEVRGEGMRYQGYSGRKSQQSISAGSLFVKFHIVYPASLNDEQRSRIREAFADIQ
ncbi:MAG: hypothetical protein EZS28_030002, partial [Streblomastix strix]